MFVLNNLERKIGVFIVNSIKLDAVHLGGYRISCAFSQFLRTFEHINIQIISDTIISCLFRLEQSTSIKNQKCSNR